MNLSGTILSFANTTLTISRPGAGSYGSDGLYNPGTTSEVTLKAAVRPASYRDLQSLPEGQREKETISVLATEELKNADRFVYNGITYETKQIQDWSDTANYYRAVAVRVDE